MSVTAPADALAKWNEDKEEIVRLKHAIEYQRERIEELARLNAELLFQAQHYKAIADAKADLADYNFRGWQECRAQFVSFAAIGATAARSVADLVNAAQDFVASRPAPVSVNSENPAASIDEAAARVGEMISGPPDDVDPVPAFLTEPHITQLPEVRP